MSKNWLITTLNTGVLVLFSIGSGLSALAQNLPDAERKTRAQQTEHALRAQFLERWYPLAVDRKNGGFLTTFTYDWQPTGAQDKMIVSQARHTWTNAKAAQRYPDVPDYRKFAAHGFAFLRNKMWDRTHGGFYTWVTREGQPKNPDDLKTAYGNAFGLYACAAHYQLTGDTAALNLAKRTFQWLETHSHDSVRLGYFQNLRRDGTPATQTAELSYKDQNSSIHLLEAFTELYRVWPDPLLGERLHEMLTLIRDTIVTDKGYLTLFLTPDWQPISYRDSSQAARKANYPLDHVSFGHDVETAFLMREAAHTLGLEHDSLTPKIGKKMVDHALQFGWDAKIGGFYERGYYFKGADTLTIIDDRKNWWAQAEGMNTLLQMAAQYPNDPMRYLAQYRTEWQYIQHYVIDSVNGGWFEGGLDKDPDRKVSNKGHAWKASYHESRAMMRCLDRLRPDQTPPTAPTQVKITVAGNRRTLQWQAAQDDRALMGYDVYRDGKRIGFTPRTRFTLPAGSNARFTVVAVDLQENASVATAAK